MKIVLALTTGRSSSKNLIRFISESLRSYGHSEEHEIILLVNFDPFFNNTRSTDFRVSEKISKTFSEVVYLGPHEANKSNSWLKKNGIDQEVADIICKPTGFGHKKNLVLAYGLKVGADSILFLDDDEYPFRCKKDGDTLTWIPSNFLQPHILPFSTQGDCLTVGESQGYRLPIFSVMCKRMSQETAVGLGLALSKVVEVISEESFIEGNYFQSEDMNHKLLHTEENKSDCMYGGNLMIPLSLVREGKIPAFYTPTDSRGDDSIFAVSLQGIPINCVQSSIFHDVFEDYGDFGNSSSKFVQPSLRHPKYLGRFALALKGWLAYAPLLTYLQEPISAPKKLEATSQLLNEVSRGLYKELPDLGELLESVPLGELLASYSSNLDSELQRYHSIQITWQRILRDNNFSAFPL